MKQSRFPLLIALVAIAALLVLVQNRPAADEGNMADGLIARILSPVQGAFLYLSEGLEKLITRYVSLSDAAKKAETAEREAAVCRMELQTQHNLLYENIRLRSLLGLREKNNISAIGARVIGVDLFGSYRSITIDHGRRDGISAKAVVVNDRGVIGRVWKLHPTSAQILLMIDPNSAIDSVVERTRAQGMVVGSASDKQLRCQMAYSLRTHDVAENDLVVTSGMDGRFPPGIPMGKVIGVSGQNEGIFLEAVLQPAVDFTKLEEVLVIDVLSGP